MGSIADIARAVTEETGEAPWPDHEYVRGWGVFGLPFDSGHVLALRVFPQGSFGPYRTVWHRDPQGRWAIYADAPHPELACPRYYGAACDVVAPARIRLDWTGRSTLRVRTDEPALDWTVQVRRSPVLGAMNALSSRMPLSSWRPRRLVRVREAMARGLGLGRIELAGAMPSGHEGLLMPGRMYLVAESTATWSGTDLGRPTRLDRNPDIGGVPLPARGVMAVGQGVWRIRDAEEFAQARELARRTQAERS